MMERMGSFGGGGMNGVGMNGSQMDFLAMQMNDLQSKMGNLQAENAQLRSSLTSLNFPMGHYGSTVNMVPAPAAGTLMRGLMRNTSQNSLVRSQSRTLPPPAGLLDEGTFVQDTVEESLLEGELRRTGSQPGSLAEWLQTQASPAERQNLVDLIQTIEDWEFSRGLAPVSRPREAGGCVTLRLGQHLRVEMRFKI